MRILLDTCVLADLRDPHGDPSVKAAVALVEEDNLYVSGLSIGEIVRGISLLPDGRKKRNLRAWLTGLQTQFGDRILGVDRETAEIWGEIVAQAHSAGQLLRVVEGLLSATALSRGLHIMTRTTPSFLAAGDGSSILTLVPRQRRLCNTGRMDHEISPGRRSDFVVSGFHGIDMGPADNEKARCREGGRHRRANRPQAGSSVGRRCSRGA